MKSEEQRIAIATALGWVIKNRQCPHSGSITEWFWYEPKSDLFEPTYRTITQTMFPSGTVVGDKIPKELPDYLNDLNSCQDMWDSLGWEEKNECVEHLKSIVNDADCEVYFATASQRCEAFLKCLNLWRE